MSVTWASVNFIVLLVYYRMSDEFALHSIPSLKTGVDDVDRSSGQVQPKCHIALPKQKTSAADTSESGASRISCEARYGGEPESRLPQKSRRFAEGSQSGRGLPSPGPPLDRKKSPLLASGPGSRESRCVGGWR